MPSIEFFATCFPSRLSDLPVVEITMQFGPDDQHDFPQQVAEIKELLISGGILAAGENFPDQGLPVGRMAWYSSLFAQTALLFQRKTGHRVNFYSVQCFPEQRRSIVLLEHEHCDVGMSATKMAAEMLSGKRKLWTEPFCVFTKFARDRLLPLGTEALIKVARSRDIPCIQLERQPYKREDFAALTDGQCISRNGLLMLGHGVHQHVLDGSFCLDKSARFRALLQHPTQRRAMLEKLEILTIDTNDISRLVAEKYHLTVVNGKVTAIIGQLDGKKQALHSVHESLIAHAVAVNHEIGLAPVTVTILTSDKSKSLAQTGGGVADFELAPDLRELGDIDASILASTASGIIDWLFPDNGSARMPTIAITGTNGKTTTSRMISHVLMRAGLKPGLVCTDGIYLNGLQIESEDQCADTGHLKVLSSKAVDIAVLETHHVGIIYRGFAFEWCDIAVCLNVTEDHLEETNIESVEQMAKVKQALPERARHAAVLNADDPHCLAMLDSVIAEKTCLVTMSHDQEALIHRVGKSFDCSCVMERVANEDWLVMYEQGRRQAVIPVKQVPATFDGTARFNVSNAMHAVAATYLAGIDIELIRSAMSDFRTDFETTPGRMNVFNDLSFRVIVDFAHNPDGFLKLTEFVDRQNVAGKKIVALSGARKRKDETLKKMARAMAGHFYFCKDYKPKSDIERTDVTQILREGLIEAGVAENQTAIKTYGKDAIFEIFDTCGPGDLLVMTIGNLEQHELPVYIREYAKRLHQNMAKSP